MRQRFALLFNARAGLAVPRLLDGVLGHLRTSGAEVFQLPARSAEEAAAAAASAASAGACDAVLAAGGDGTFRAVASGLAGSATPVGFIPLGTGNVLAHELRLGRRARGIAETLLGGPEIPVRGGLVNGAPFFLMAGAGFDGAIVAGLDYRTKRAFGRAAYVGPVLRALAAGPRSFDVEVNGQEFEASWVIATFAGRYAGSLRLTEDARVGANRLLAVVVAARTRGELIRASLALALGRLTRVGAHPPFVKVMPADVLRIGFRTAVPAEVDGDVAGLTPLDVRAAGATVRVIVPPAYAATLTNRHANHLL